MTEKEELKIILKVKKKLQDSGLIHESRGNYVLIVPIDLWHEAFQTSRALLHGLIKTYG